jgi:hypothetical protein
MRIQRIPIRFWIWIPDTAINTGMLATAETQTTTRMQSKAMNASKSTVRTSAPVRTATTALTAATAGTQATAETTVIARKLAIAGTSATVGLTMTGWKKATTETMNMADSKSGRDYSNRDVSILVTQRLKGRHQLMLYCGNQCCGTGTGTARTVTFRISGTGTGMQYGSGSGSRTEFGYESNIKQNQKVKKSKLRYQLSGK